MSAQWYYMLGDKKLGPVTAGQLKQLAQTGQLQPTDKVWKEGMKSWVPAEKVKGLIQTTPLPIPSPKAEATGSDANEKVPPPPPSTAGRSASPVQMPTDRGRVILTRAVESWRALKLQTRIAIGSSLALVAIAFLWIVAASLTATPVDPVNRENLTIIRQKELSLSEVESLMGRPADETYSVPNGTTHNKWKSGERLIDVLYDRNGHFYQVVSVKLPKDNTTSETSKNEPRNSASPYDEGYSKGVSTANNWLRKLRSMAPAAQREFVSVYRNELSGYERNRDQLTRAYGANSDDARRYTGLCNGIRDTMKKAGFNL